MLQVQWWLNLVFCYLGFHRRTTNMCSTGCLRLVVTASVRHKTWSPIFVEIARTSAMSNVGTFRGQWCVCFVWGTSVNWFFFCLSLWISSPRAWAPIINSIIIGWTRFHLITCMAGCKHISNIMQYLQKGCVWTWGNLSKSLGFKPFWTWFPHSNSFKMPWFGK